MLTPACLLLAANCTLSCWLHCAQQVNRGSVSPAWQCPLSCHHLWRFVLFVRKCPDLSIWQVCIARSAKLDLCMLVILYRPLTGHAPQHGLFSMFSQAQTWRLSMDLDVSVSCHCSAIVSFCSFCPGKLPQTVGAKQKRPLQSAASWHAPYSHTLTAPLRLATAAQYLCCTLVKKA